MRIVSTRDNTQVKNSSWRYVWLTAILVLAALVRLYGIRGAGVIYPDDLRAYVGPELVRSLEVPLGGGGRLAAWYEITVAHTAVRPALAWLVAIPASLGLTSLGYLYMPFGIFGVISIILTWVFCARSFNSTSAGFAALWLAFNAMHVNYSRSALPSTPGLAFVLAGNLLALSIADKFVFHSARRLLLVVGLCFAMAFAFHPLHLLYALAPTLWLWKKFLDQPAWTWSSLLTLVQTGFFIGLPTVALVALHDAPRLIFDLALGTSDPRHLLYCAGLFRLALSPTILGHQEGPIFWVRALASAGGFVAFLLTLCAVLAAFFLRPKNKLEQGRLWFLLLWLGVPFLLLGFAPKLNSLGRLYAPCLVPLACLVGLGTSKMTSRLAQLIPHVGTLLNPILAILFLSFGLYACASVVRFPGQEPLVAQYMRNHGIERAVGFTRTDWRALIGVQLQTAYSPSEFDQALCEQQTTFAILSPAPVYLIVRNKEYLFENLKLEKTFVYPNPYRVGARLWDGITAEERDSILNDPRLAELGLYKVSRMPSCK